jgi:hypothetical protein
MPFVIRQLTTITKIYLIYKKIEFLLFRITTMYADLYNVETHGKSMFKVHGKKERKVYAVTDNRRIDTKEHVLIFKKVPERPVWAVLRVKKVKEGEEIWTNFTNIWFIHVDVICHSQTFGGPSGNNFFADFKGFNPSEPFESETEREWIELFKNESFCVGKLRDWTVYKDSATDKTSSDDEAASGKPLIASLYDNEVHGRDIFRVKVNKEKHDVTDNVLIDCDKKSLIFKKVPGRMTWAALVVRNGSQNWKEFEKIWFIDQNKEHEGGGFHLDTMYPCTAIFKSSHLQDTFPSEKEADWVDFIKRQSFVLHKNGGWIPVKRDTPRPGEGAACPSEDDACPSEGAACPSEDDAWASEDETRPHKRSRK